MISRHFRKIAILIAILAMLLAACGPQETETPEPTEEPVATEEATEEPAEVEETEEPVEATAEAAEATEEMTEEPMDDMEETEEPMDDMEETEEPMDDMEETEEPMDDMEETEEPMDDMEETEEPMDDMEETEEPMDDMEETEEPMDDMEMTEEPMDDMGDGAVVTFDDGAGFTFDYPEGYEVTTNTDSSVITLDMGEQRIIVISPANWALVVGDEEGTLEEQLAFFVERLGYTAGESSDMMMADASINIELPRRGLVGYANLSDVENGNYAVVIELGPDADSIPSADGAVISSSMVMFVVQAEPIAIGDTIAASIEAGRRNSYELTLADGDVVNIYLNGLEGLDTYLRVYDADGNLIAENDDFSGVSSGLEGFTVEGGGVVTVEAGTFGDSAAGDYELVVEAAVAEEPMDDMEATEEPMDDMEATEEPMDDMEATEEPMDDMEATEEPMDDMDMDDGAVVTYDDGAGFTFDYPEGYEVTTNTDASVVTLDMGEQRLIVIAPASWALVVGDEEGTLEEQLAFFVERLGYTAGESSDMMMSDASISIELPRRNLVGYANLSDLGDGNIVVVLELGSDADSIPSADGAVISSTVAYNPPPPPEEEAAPEDEAAAESSLTILGVALQTENLQTLLVAVQRGGYLATFNGEGSFTVFAPTDDAFATALDELGLTAEELLDDEELLNSVLTYHVVEGAVFSGDLEDGMEVVTLNGAILTINVTDEGVTVTDGNGNTYNVIAADVEASNGVVHIIDGVLLPPME